MDVCFSSCDCSGAAAWLGLRRWTWQTRSQATLHPMTALYDWHCTVPPCAACREWKAQVQSPKHTSGTRQCEMF